MNTPTLMGYSLRTMGIPKELISWWTFQMGREPHMLGESAERVIETIEYAYFFFDDNVPIAASGLFGARSKTKECLRFEGTRVVEVGSSVVEPTYRGRGLGKRVMKECVEKAWERELLPVGVSSNPIVHHIFESFGGLSMDDDQRYQELRQQLCLCEQVSPDCRLCPLAERGGWIFFPHARQRREYSDFHGL